jgi:hypothetical protein
MLSTVVVDKLILHPIRRIDKIQNFYQIENTRRIFQLEQSIAGLNLPYVARPHLKAAEACVASAVAKIKADYDATRSEFRKCEQSVAAYVSTWLPQASERQRFAAFITAVTSQLGQYGSSSETDVRAIAKSDVLNCAQTTIFVARTIKALYPDVQVSEVHIKNDSFGEHGLVEIKDRESSFVVDGLTGTIYLASLDEMFTPQPKLVAMIDFFDENDQRIAEMFAEFARTVQLGHLSEKDIVRIDKLS